MIFQEQNAQKWLGYGPIKSLAKILQLQWEKGWAEHRGGNSSYRLSPEECREITPICNPHPPLLPTPLPVPALAGETFITSGTCCYSRHACESPAKTLGIVRICSDGKKMEVLWGFEATGRPTSEMATHLLGHQIRMERSEGKERAIVHAHPTNLIALSFVLPASTAEFSKKLWLMMPECYVVFPDGIGVVPYMLPGSLEIGQASAKMMQQHRLVLWHQHGLFASEKDLESAFGLMDAAEKGAEILVKVLSMGGIKQPTRTIEEDRALMQAFELKPLALSS